MRCDGAAGATRLRLGGGLRCVGGSDGTTTCAVINNVATFRRFHADELAEAQARASDDQAPIAHLKRQIAKLQRLQSGPHAECPARLLDRLELQLEELEAAVDEDEVVAEQAAAQASRVAAFHRRRSARKPFPEHLPRERVVIPAPTSCPCCCGTRLSRLGEDVTERPEVVPGSWKVIQHVREQVACRPERA